MKIPTLEEMDDAIEGLLELFQEDDKEIEKANPYHDAGGKFTSADKAVAPKGKKPKLKAVGGKEKTLPVLSESMDLASGIDERWNPSSLVAAGVISEAEFEQHWNDFVKKQGSNIGTETRSFVDSKDFVYAYTSLDVWTRAKFCKSLVVTTVGKTLEEKFTSKELGEFLHGTDGHEASGEAVVQKVLNAWAESSAKDTSIHLGEAARILFDADGSLADLHEEQVAFDYKNGFIGRVSLEARVMETVAQTIYDNTQKYLQSFGVAEAILSRGTSTETITMNIGWDEVNDRPVRNSANEAVTQRPIASWSLDTLTAQEFTGDGYGVVVTARIPVERIFSTPLTGIGCLSESEFVVLAPKNGKQTVTVDIGEAA